MKTIFIAAALSLGLTGAALAQSPPMVKGTVEKVDTAAGKVTLDHERVPNLDMDAMSMVWKAQSASMLKGLKAGDKVQFTADRVNGQLTLTKIQKAK